MIRKSRVPPDSGVDILGKILAVQVGSGFFVGAVEVYRVRPGNHHLRGFAFAGVHVDGGLLRGAARLRSAPIENIDYIVMRLIQLALGEVGQQMLVAAMAVDDN